MLGHARHSSSSIGRAWGCNPMLDIRAAYVSASVAFARRDNGHMAEAMKQQWIHAYEGMAEVG